MNTVVKCVMSNAPITNWTKMLQIKCMKVLSQGHKNHFKDQCLINLQWTFLIFPSFFDSVSWWCHQKYVNQITSNCLTLWILDLAIFNVFVWILLVVNLSWNQTLLIFLLDIRQSWKTQLIEVISLWEVIFL